MTRIQLRRDTAANWTAANPLLASGEVGYETDTKKRKTGDGATTWTALAYDAAGGGGAATTDAGALVTGTLADARLSTATATALAAATSAVQPAALTTETNRALNAERAGNGRALAYSIALGG